MTEAHHELGNLYVEEAGFKLWVLPCPATALHSFLYLNNFPSSRDIPFPVYTFVSRWAFWVASTLDILHSHLYRSRMTEPCSYTFSTSYSLLFKLDK